ncbi:MAG: hypothetical protein ACE5NG_19365 [bacterium]
MARRKKRRKRRGFGVRNAFKFIRLGALALGGASAAIQYKDPKYMLANGLGAYAGVQVQENGIFFNFERFKMAWLPYLLSVVATVGISKLSGLLRRF